MRPLGILVGVINFISAIIIGKLVPLLHCENIQNERLSKVIFIYVFTYANSVVLAVLTAGLPARTVVLQYGK